MQVPNTPHHHTSHDLENASSSSGIMVGDSTHPIQHHTSHTMGNGASSGSAGGGAGGSCSVDGHDAATASAPSVTSACAENPDSTTQASSREPDATHEQPETETETRPSSRRSSSAGTASDDDDDNSLRRVSSTEASSLSSSTTLPNFSIIDTTLREGEQFASAHFTTEDKIAIAQALDEFGVEYIELTSPVASEQSRLDCEAICKLGLKAKILCHIRCNMEDARVAIETGVDGINVCIGTSAILMEHSHGKGMAFIAAKAKEVVQYAQAHNTEVRFSGEDTFRSNFDDIVELYTGIDKLGVNRIGIADTVGGASPREVFEKISTLRRALSCDMETHFHNDTGCAIANAYTALEAGATHIDTTVLGIGERNGITPIAGLLGCLMNTGNEYVVDKYKMERLRHLEELVARIVGVEIPFNTASTGVLKKVARLMAEN